MVVLVIVSIESTEDKKEYNGGKALAATLMVFDNGKDEEEDVAEYRHKDAVVYAIGNRGRTLVAVDEMIIESTLVERLNENSMHGEKDCYKDVGFNHLVYWTNGA